MASVLLIAPGAERNDIGEAWVAFQWASRLANRYDVTLLTHRKRGRPSAKAQLENVEVIEWDELPIFGRAERFNSLAKPWYPYFHYRCKRWIRAAQDAGRTFDIGHQPVPVAMRYPSPLEGSGIPYVIGPVGGSMSSPKGFADQDTAPWYVNLREIDDFRLRRDPFLRRTYSNAAVVLGIAPYVGEALLTVPVQKFIVMSETGVESVPTVVTRPSSPDLIHLLFVGRLIRTKGARDAINAMQHVLDLPVVLDIVGDGFDRQACIELALELGVSDRVMFHGSRPHEEVEAFYRAADIFVFPSFREPGGNVAFEAMSYGLPLIVSDRGGPGTTVTDDCGIRITPVDPESYAHGIADAVRRLVDNGAERAAMGQAARRRVLEYGTWDQHMATIDKIYAQILDSRA